MSDDEDVEIIRFHGKIRDAIREMAERYKCSVEDVAAGVFSFFLYCQSQHDGGMHIVSEDPKNTEKSRT